ncbi:hypothetical protein B0J12DRAFT_702366 [Macrophomina phaseolina]|uniref:Zn(2)-C6 fungal-type domain-containing protein n=1 Tax=Macrophomina phaseolina TaxID=35725 RepID=A0ABQ8G1Q1_9PEZI|nr:hypothetical protein B0J12DRAFT_702366 [Macrophomina phaseolina]
MNPPQLEGNAGTNQHPHLRIALACLYCRRRKIRCQGRDISGRCQNCHQAGCECVFRRVGTVVAEYRQNVSNAGNEAWTHGGFQQLPPLEAYSGMNSLSPTTGLRHQATRGSQQSIHAMASFAPYSIGLALLPPPDNPVHGPFNPPAWPPQFPHSLAETGSFQQYSNYTRYGSR